MTTTTTGTDENIIQESDYRDSRNAKDFLELHLFMFINSTVDVECAIG